MSNFESNNIGIEDQLLDAITITCTYLYINNQNQLLTIEKIKILFIDVLHNYCTEMNVTLVASFSAVT